MTRSCHDPGFGAFFAFGSAKAEVEIRAADMTCGPLFS